LLPLIPPIQKNLTSALDRYGNEIKRVTGVLNAHLKKQGTPYLLGDKVTYADLAWVPWQKDYAALMPGWDYEAELPEFAAWNKRLLERPSVKKVLAHKDFQRS
jgi:glutathione S-transferase